MSRRSDCIGIVVYGIALAILTALSCNPQAGARPAAGMSAPPVPQISIVAAPSVALPSSHASGSAKRDSGEKLQYPIQFLAWTPAVSQDAQSHRHYGPLHRRPPPALS